MPADPTSGTVTLVLVLAGVATLIGLARSWGSFWDDDFTSSDQRRALQVAIFVVPAIAVAFHELGHALAAWVVGARVVDFRYGFFEGSVTIAGRLSAAETWFVALSGNAVSVALGLGLVGAGSRVARRPTARYLLMTSGLIGLAFALVGYPLLSASTGFGDWVVIYDLSEARVPSLATGLVHLAIVASLVRWWRRSGHEQLLTVREDSRQHLGEAREEVRARPGEAGPRLALTQVYLDLGSAAMASRVLNEAAAEGVEPARINLARARLALSTQRWSDAVVAATAGLSGAGTDDQHQRLRANLVVGLARMGRWGLVLEATQGLTGPVAADPRIRYCRAMALLETGDSGAGRALMDEVAGSLPPEDLLGRWASARLAGTTPEVGDQRHLPASRRARQPPPEPLGAF